MEARELAALLSELRFARERANERARLIECAAWLQVLTITRGESAHP
jgi:hypothetical protein